jgi:hypothetical protein
MCRNFIKFHQPMSDGSEDSCGGVKIFYNIFKIVHSRSNMYTPNITFDFDGKKFSRTLNVYI